MEGLSAVRPAEPRVRTPSGRPQRASQIRAGFDVQVGWPGLFVRLPVPVVIRWQTLFLSVMMSCRVDRRLSAQEFSRVDERWRKGLI